MKQDATRNVPAAELLDRQPPADEIAERAVVGFGLINPDALHIAGIYDVHFFHEPTRAVFRAIRDAQRAGDVVSVPGIAKRLKDDPLFEHTGAASYVTKLFEYSDAVRIRFSEFAARLKELERRRRFFAAMLTGIRSVFGEHPTDEIIGDAVEQFQILAAEGAESIDYGGMTCRELFDSVDDTHYHVPNILAADQPCIVAAPSKSLKTLTMLDLAVSLATATPLFGEIDVPEPVRIGTMSGESGRSVIRRNLITICEARGIDLPDIDGLIVAPKLPKFGSVEHAEAVRRFIRQHRLRVLVVDPVYLAMPSADVGNVFAQGELLGAMNQVCVDEGCGLVIVHHTKHVGPAEYGVPELSDIAWSGFAEFARQWILLRRRERYTPGSGLHRLWFNCGGSAGHQFLRALDIDEGTPDDRRWHVTLAHADEARQAERSDAEARREQAKHEAAQRARQKLVDTAKRYPAGETLTALRDASGLATAVCRQALSEAIRRHELVPCTVKKTSATNKDTGSQTMNNTTVGIGRERSVGQDGIPGAAPVVGKGAICIAPPVRPTADCGTPPPVGKVEEYPDRCRCGSREHVEVEIHNGQSVRRDCKRCRRFLAFVKWYGADVSTTTSDKARSLGKTGPSPTPARGFPTASTRIFTQKRL